ncbi:MAG: hypothetical protein PHC61_00925 [Chitinivibrionales bacterium]|nr:hypothetical protein [Chitinivibrionales bacterium]
MKKHLLTAVALLISFGMFNGLFSAPDSTTTTKQVQTAKPKRTAGVPPVKKAAPAATQSAPAQNAPAARVMVPTGPSQLPPIPANAQTFQPSNVPTSSNSPMLQRPNPPTSSNDAPINLYPIELLPIPDSIKIPVLDFKNTDIRDILRGLGMQYHVNIYLDPEVKGPTSLYLTDVSLKYAVDFIIKRSSFAYTVENKIIKVYKFTSPPPPPPQEPAVVFHLSGGMLDIDVKNISAQKAATLFTDTCGLNVVIDGKIDKTITAHLKSLPPRRALKVMFETNGMDVANSDSVYYVSAANWGTTDQGNQQQGSKPNNRLSIAVNKANRVTLEVNNASLDQVIRTLAIQSGINIVIYDNATGTVSAKFDSTYIDDALRFLLQNTKLTFWKDKTIYFIGSREMNQQKTSQLIVLKHIMADEEILSKQLPPHLMKDAIVKYDKEHNAIIVIGSFDIVAQMQDFIDKIDQPVPQVLLEALVVDFSVNKFRQYGVTFFTGGTAPDSASHGTSTEEYFPQVTNVGAGSARIASAMRQVLKFLNINQVVALPANFMANINALEGADVAKVYSTPQIATLNGNPASITIGETRYFKQVQQADVNNGAAAPYRITTNENFEKIQFNNKLEITPWVMADRYVTVKIKPEFNIPRSEANSDVPPSVDTRVLESTVRLKDGQTIVLGGQRQTSTTTSTRSLPFLGSIPIIGWLFSSHNTEKVQTQMMIFLTPHIYYNEEGAVIPGDYFDEGLNRKDLKSSKRPWWKFWDNNKVNK